jgi:hypothetical protein
MWTASTVCLYVGGCFKPPASTNISPDRHLSHPLAHWSKLTSGRNGLTHTHSQTRCFAPNLATAASSREPCHNRPCPATVACELRPRATAASSRLSPATAHTNTRAPLPPSLLAVEEELGGQLTQSSTSSSLTDVEIHKRRMASSSTSNIS